MIVREENLFSYLGYCLLRVEAPLLRCDELLPLLRELLRWFVPELALLDTLLLLLRCDEVLLLRSDVALLR